MKREVEDCDEAVAPKSSVLKNPIAMASNGVTTTRKNHTIRVRDNLISPDAFEPTMFNKKARKEKTLSTIDVEVAQLREDVQALEWLAKEKEREWNQVLRLLKKKEELLKKGERAQSIKRIETENRIANLIPPPATSSLPAQPQTVRRVIIPKSKLPPNAAPGAAIKVVDTITGSTKTLALKTVISSAAASSVLTLSNASKSQVIPSSFSTTGEDSSPKIVSVTSNQASDPISSHIHTVIVPDSPSKIRYLTADVVANPSVMMQATKSDNQKAKTQKAGPLSSKKQSQQCQSMCQGCRKVASKFVCAGCSKRWYCSRQCQVEDWNFHAEDCEDSD